MGKDLIIRLQQEQLRVQARLIAEQNTMIKLFESRIVLLENNQKKDSPNSSKPPSSDMGKVQHTKSLRMKSGKNPEVSRVILVRHSASVQLLMK